MPRLTIVRQLAAAIIAIACVGVRLSSAQCGEWQYGPGQGFNGFNDYVRAIEQWDPDGIGSLPPVIVYGGNFTRAGDQSTNHIAVWDGSRFNPLGEGFNGNVLALTVFNGELIAAGEFTMSGETPVNHIAVWKDSGWQSIGEGLTGVVNALCVFGDKLCVGGWFSAVGSGVNSGVAAWDGIAWGPVGESFDSTTLALFEWNGQLIAGGRFTQIGGAQAKRIAQWNGASWSEIGGGIPNGAIYALTEFNGELIVAGGFAVSSLHYHISRWNGEAWNSLPYGPNSFIYSVCTYQGELLAGSGYTGSGLTGQVSKWNGFAWSRAGRLIGINGSSISFAFAMKAADDGSLHIGGDFGVVDDYQVEYGAYFKPDSWNSFRTGLPSDPLTKMTVLCDRLYALAGRTRSFYNGIHYDDMVLEWVDGAWNPIARQIYLQIHTATCYQGDLVLGGSIREIEGVAVRGIARRHNGVWGPMDFASDGFTLGLLSTGDELYGIFGRSIKRWTGSAWIAVGPSFANNLFELIAFDSTIAVVEERDVPGYPESTVHVWDGAAWRSLGEPFVATPGVHMRLCEYHGELYAAGAFFKTGSTHLAGIARWNGTAWERVGGGLNGSVRWISRYLDTLVVQGSFTRADVLPAPGNAVWNGATWAIPGWTAASAADGAVEYRGELLFWNSDWANPPAPPGSRYWFRWDGRLPGDANQDQVVDHADLSTVIAAWGQPGPVGDANFDGQVDFDDITAALSNWAATCD